MQTRKT